MTLSVSAPFVLSDPQGGSALAEAGRWVQQAMLGTVATTVAVIAVASIGFLMLTGRVQLRRGATVVVGCFVLFGAPTIAAGLRGLAAEAAPPAPPPDPPVIPPPATPIPPPQPGVYDPYAGASVPPR